MIDVKKLITGFLILAVAAVGSGLILSFAGNFIPAAATSAQPTIGGLGTAGGTSPTIGGVSAFVDTGSLQGNAAEMLTNIDTSSTAKAANDPTNLTNTFAESFLNGLVVANPGGVSTDSNGNLVFSSPDTAAVAAIISSDPSMKNFTSPNWDAEAAAQKIKVSKTSSPNDIAQYSNSLNAVFNKYFVSTNLQNIISSNNGDPAEVAYISGQLQGALNSLVTVPTPATLVNFQKSLVKVVVYEKNLAQLTQNAGTDPVRAALVIQNKQDQYSSAVDSLKQQMQQASNLGLLFGKTNTTAPSVPFIAQLFGVKPAYAIFGIGDITFDPTVFGEMLLNYLKDTALQILKNSLVSLIQRKVLTWIQGSGAPRFVTDFGSQLVNSYQTAAISKLNSYMKCVPSYQIGSVNALISTPAVANNNICDSQFNGQLGNNFQNFYNHFDNFNNYLNLFTAGGNAWSVAVQVRDAAIVAGGQSQAAQQTQTISQQGWIGSSVCSDGTDPNGTHYYCEDGTVPDSSHMCGGGGGLLQTEALISPNNGACPDPNHPIPTVTNPGQVTGQGFFASLKGGVENITSANNIAGIIGALTTSLLNSLAQSAINYSNQAVNNALNGTSGGPSDSGVVGISSSTLINPVAQQPAAQCSPSIQFSTISTSTGQADANLSAAGGAIDTTCGINNTCPATENSDGTPHYYWSAPGSLQSLNGTPVIGNSSLLSYNATGTYFVTVTASTDQSSSTCEVDIQ